MVSHLPFRSMLIMLLAQGLRLLWSRSNGVALIISLKAHGAACFA
jgi:hypothetical protein